MFNRILRLFSSGISAYSFYSNPFRFIVSLLAVLLIPYLTYIFWGVTLIIILAIIGLYFTYKAVRNSMENRSMYY